MAKMAQCKQCKEFWKVTHSGRACFCSKSCSDTWWDEARSKHETRSQVAAKIHGKAPSVEMSDMQAVWLAGLIDGEGCIGIWREKRANNTSGFRYQSAVVIANTHRGLIDVVASIVPGKIRLSDKRKNPLHKPLFQFRITARAVGAVLERIAPYLVIKRRQAELLMQYRNAVENAPVRASRDHEIFDALWRECKALNKRGLPALEV